MTIKIVSWFRWIPVVLGVPLMVWALLSALIAIIFGDGSIAWRSLPILATGFLLVASDLRVPWPTDKLTTHQVKTAAIFTCPLTAIAGYVWFMIASGTGLDWYFAPLVMTFGAPLGKNVLESIHERWMQPGILKNLAIATNQTEPVDPELHRLANNSALPDSIYYSMTVCPPLTEGFVRLGFDSWEAISVSVVTTVYLAAIWFATCKGQRAIRRYIRSTHGPSVV